MSPRKVPELPANVHKIRPDVVMKRRVGRPKRVKPGVQAPLVSVTQGDPDLITKTQAPKAKKPSADKLIAMTHASLQLPESDDVASLVLSRQQERKAFLKLVASLGETELRERFPLEAASHSNMKARRRTHGAVIHPEFEDFRPFLLHLGARPVQSYTLDRLDPHDPEYAPGKVAWRDKRSQANTPCANSQKCGRFRRTGLTSFATCADRGA